MNNNIRTKKSRQKSKQMFGWGVLKGKPQKD